MMCACVVDTKFAKNKTKLKLCCALYFPHEIFFFSMCIFSSHMWLYSKKMKKKSTSDRKIDSVYYSELAHSVVFM